MKIIEKIICDSLKESNTTIQNLDLITKDVLYCFKNVDVNVNMSMRGIFFNKMLKTYDFDDVQNLIEIIAKNINNFYVQFLFRTIAVDNNMRQGVIFSNLLKRCERYFLPFPFIDYKSIANMLLYKRIQRTMFDILSEEI